MLLDMLTSRIQTVRIPCCTITERNPAAGIRTNYSIMATNYRQLHKCFCDKCLTDFALNNKLLEECSTRLCTAEL